MKIFVYGTLKSTSTRPDILMNSAALLLGYAKTVRKHIMYNSGNFPCLVESDKEYGHRIKGEVWDLNGDDVNILHKLDHYEGAPRLFRRGSIMVDLDDTTIQTLCYYITNPEVPEDKLYHINEF